MERYYTTNMGYSSAALPTTACRTELSAHYSFAFSAGPAAATYTLAATTQGSQASHDSCGTLTINQAWTKTPTTAGCWEAIPNVDIGNKKPAGRRGHHGWRQKLDSHQTPPT